LHLEHLRDLQQKILKHLLGCNNEGVESSSHIARTLHAHQPAVHRSVNALMKKEYLVKEKKCVQWAKSVILTSKGATAAVLLGGSTFNNQAASLRLK
jgi:hypothetical protein